MTPVRLRSHKDQITIEDELDNQVRAFIALETGRDIPDGHEDALLARLQSIAADIKVHLQKNVELSEDLQKVSDTQQRGGRKQRKGPKHIAVEDDAKPSVGPAEDTPALEKDVTELAARIEAHCEEFPQRVAHQLSEHLQRIRPLATSSDPPETDENLDTRLEPVSGLPSMAELQEKLGGAVTTLLGLQKRLELAEAKASRVVNAVEQERSRGGPSLTEQVIAEHDKVMGYLEDKARARGTKRAATTSDLGGSPMTRSRSKV